MIKINTQKKSLWTKILIWDMIGLVLFSFGASLDGAGVRIDEIVDSDINKKLEKSKYFI